MLPVVKVTAKTLAERMADHLLTRSNGPAEPTAVALFLHGGRVRSRARVSRINPAVLRIDLLVASVQRHLVDSGVQAGLARGVRCVTSRSPRLAA